jgi:hypothetical protein
MLHIRRKIMNTIKDMVSNSKKVQFIRYQSQELWYKTECGFEFPVPLSDTGEAAFIAEDKALLFMRWIRKHVDTINTAKQDQMV